MRACKRTTSRAFRNASNLCIAIRNDRLEVGESNSVISVIGVSRFGAIPNPKGVVARKLTNRVTVTNVLVNQKVERLAGRGRGGIDVRDERRTVVELSTYAIVLVALIEGFLQDIGTVRKGRPAVDEVTVHRVASSVASRENPSDIASTVEREILNVVDEFVE